MEIENDERMKFRVVTIGDSCVGKTCVLNRFLKNSFNAEEANTVGGLFKSYVQEVNGTPVELQLWDTAGQEQYRSLAPVYFRGGSAALIMFDITNRASFEDIDDWLTTFRNHSGESALMYLVGNKCDLENDRQISMQEAKQWALANRCSYYETSALSGEGIPQLFNNLVQDLVKTCSLPMSQSNVERENTVVKQKSGCNC